MLQAKLPKVKDQPIPEGLLWLLLTGEVSRSMKTACAALEPAWGLGLECACTAQFVQDLAQGQLAAARGWPLKQLRLHAWKPQGTQLQQLGL